MDTVSIDSRALYAQLGTADAPHILDTRKDKAYEADDRVLPGTIRTGPDPSAFAASHAPDRPVVVYCVYGHEVGRATALPLRAQGALPAVELTAGERPSGLSIRGDCVVRPRGGSDATCSMCCALVPVGTCHG